MHAPRDGRGAALSSTAAPRDLDRSNPGVNGMTQEFSCHGTPSMISCSQVAFPEHEVSRPSCLFALGIAVTAQLSSAQSTDFRTSRIVAERQARMFDLQTAYWVLFDVANGKSSDYAAAAVAAGSMTGLMDQFLALLDPGTTKGEAPVSRARPEVWTDTDGLRSAAGAFTDRATTFAEAASSADPDRVAAEFGLLTAACTSCHGLRPSSDGPYRFPSRD